MADLMREFGWIAWCLTVIGWFLSPIISLLVNKLLVCFGFDASTNLKELEIRTIPRLKQTLEDVEEKMVLIAAQDKGSLFDLKILDTVKKDLKSALYEAEDILDLVDYHRIEKGLYLGDDGSRRWVEYKLGAACVWIAHCKGSWFGRWIDVIQAGVVKKGAQSMTRQALFLWRHSRQNFDLFCVRREINIAGAAVLQCLQNWYQQLGQLFTRVILRRSGVLLPVSIDPTPQTPCPESRGSVFVPADPPCRPAEEMVDEEEIVEETQVEEGEADIGVVEIEAGEGGEMPEEIEGGCGGELGETSKEELEEYDKEGKEGEPTSSSILRYSARSMLTWFVKACFYRDWSYEIVGIKSDKEDGSAAELVPITERICLKNRIKRIEDILTVWKKSDLLNGSSITAKDADKESSSCTIKNSAKENSSKQKETDDLYRNIEQKVFGREEDREHISTMLRKGPDTYTASSSTSKPYSVIGMYGITGSGKSTLAQYVCDYEKGARHFDPIMFIYVGKTFSLGDILRDMLEQIKQSGSSNDKDLKSLKTELCENLKDKRFLLVLDDVWVDDDNQKERDILLDTLNAAPSGSRILVTAQKKDAAEALGAQEQISIPDLEEKVYLSLVMHHAGLRYAADDYGNYEKIGRKIANRLCRSPIAAVTVGKQLRRNKSISFWETTANLEMLNKTMGALWWSYQQLGVDTRRCFAYCSIFPKAYRLKRDELVRIWIAQGFVNTRSNTTEEPEDVGQRYFDELLSFSFLQAERNYFLSMGTMTFTIHDLLHELAERVSGSEFFRIGLNGSPEDIPRGVRHLFIERKNVAGINEKNVDLGNLRTLIINEDPYAKTEGVLEIALKKMLNFFNEKVETIKRNHDLEKDLGQLFIRLKKLRVLIIILNFRTLELSIPASIDHIRHLRYLGFHFRGSLINLILPSTFSKLYHIQIIDIPCEGASCPEDMANLIYLRSISAPLCCPNIGKLTSLQTLDKFVVKEEQGYELKQLMHLKKLRHRLRVEGLVNVGSKEEALEAHLAHKERLRKLELNFGSDMRFGTASTDVQAEVLEGLCPPKDLEELTIWFYRASTYPSWMLSRHDSDAPKELHILELVYCSQLAYIPEDSKLFIGLRELQIFGCDWDRLPQNMERLVSLQTLEISVCNKLELLPTLPHQALKTISIIKCHMLSRTCQEVGHENWRKIKDIPMKKFW